jgi:hypothetical protein
VQTKGTREYEFRYFRNPEILWGFTRNTPGIDGNSEWRVGTTHPRLDVEGHRLNLEQTCDLLNSLEKTKAQLEADLTEAQKTLRSLQEDLSSFSTFEQVCNSGMLRNFKIDSESQFAQTILSLLQRVMELQISLLDPKTTERPEVPHETSTGTTDVPAEPNQGLTGPDDAVRPMEGTA